MPQPHEAFVKVEYLESQRCAIVLANSNEVRRSIRALATLCGAAPRQGDALIAAIERIDASRQAARRLASGSSKLATQWHWDTHMIKQAKKCGVYTPKIAWADRLSLYCERLPGGRLRLVVWWDGHQPFDRHALCTALGVSAEPPLESARVILTLAYGKEYDDMTVSAMPLLAALGQLCREPCRVVPQADGCEYDYERIEGAEQLAKYLAEAFGKGVGIVIGDDPVFYPEHSTPRGDLVAVSIYTLSNEGGLVAATPYGEVLSVAVGHLGGERELRRLRIEVDIVSPHPTEAVNNTAFRKLVDAFAAELLRRYKADIAQE